MLRLKPLHENSFSISFFNFYVIVCTYKLKIDSKKQKRIHSKNYIEIKAEELYTYAHMLVKFLQLYLVFKNIAKIVS